MTDIADSRIKATPAEIEQAREMYAKGSDDNIEVDDNARCSVSECGVWVAGWLYVSDEELEAGVEEVVEEASPGQKLENVLDVLDVARGFGP